MSNKFAEALDTGNFHAGKACVDCYYTLANGEPSTSHPDWDVAQFDRTCAEWDITLGHLHDGEWSDCVHKGEPCEEDCDCEYDSFSTLACDVCGSTLHGAREDVIMIKRELLK
jgi:hypothetical protein